MVFCICQSSFNIPTDAVESVLIKILLMLIEQLIETRLSASIKKN